MSRLFCKLYTNLIQFKSTLLLMGLILFMLLVRIFQILNYYFISTCKSMLFFYKSKLFYEFGTWILYFTNYTSLIWTYDIIFGQNFGGLCRQTGTPVLTYGTLHIHGGYIARRFSELRNSNDDVIVEKQITQFYVLVLDVYFVQFYMA